MSVIPIRNIYYLLSYAWDLLEEAQELAVEAEDLPNVVDLLARLLTQGTKRLLRRGMDRGYRPQTEVLSTLRGRVDFGASSRRLLLEQAKAQCDFEEFLPDLLHNQILKATLLALSSCQDLAGRQKAEIHAVMRRLEGISQIRIRKSHFGQVRLHRNNAHYRLLIHICELVHDNLLVNEQEGQRTFRDFLKDEHQMWKLFEAFFAHFYEKETDWDVRTQEHIPWDCPNPGDLLPEMQADAVLRGEGRVVVVECKFYPEMLQTSPWSVRPKIRSAHLYQLTTYLRNMKGADPDQRAEGLLVYPANGVGLAEDFLLAGAKVRVCTVDLACAWEDVAEQMKGLPRTKRA